MLTVVECEEGFWKRDLGVLSLMKLSLKGRTVLYPRHLDGLRDRLWIRGSLDDPISPFEWTAPSNEVRSRFYRVVVSS